MPTYTYACTECGHRFDARQSMQDPPLTSCPQCTGILRKMISAPLVLLGGSCSAGADPVGRSGGCCG